MNKKLSDIQGMEIPHYSKDELKELLSKDDLWEFLTNVYPDAIKSDDKITQTGSLSSIDVQVNSQQLNIFASTKAHQPDKEEKNWKTNQVSLANLLI